MSLICVIRYLRNCRIKNSARVIVGAIVLALFSWIPMANAATEAQRLTAIQKALSYLYKNQQPQGYWKAAGYEQAATGAAAFAFLSQRDKWGNDSIRYQAAVDRAMAYLTSTATALDVSMRTDGINICPDHAGLCKGIYWYGSAQSLYTTGLVTPAIAIYGLATGPNVVAAASGPLAGMTWREIAQGITNALAVSQSTPESGDRSGGWRYLPGNGDSDNSATQWAVTALIYDESLGAITPQIVRDELKNWLRTVPNASGAVCFQPGSEPCNHAETGGWLTGMHFVGSDLEISQMRAALDFLNVFWKSTANALSYGNFGNPYAMWSVYQGLETTIGLNDTTHITNLLTDCDANTNEYPGNTSVPCTWSEDYNQWLIKNQAVDGSWAGSSYPSDSVATALCINILGRTRMPAPAAGSSERTASGQQMRPKTAVVSGRRAFSQPAITATTQAPQPTTNSNKLRPYLRKGVTALAVKGDGSVLASGGTDNKIRIWSAATGLQTLVFPPSAGLPTGLAFSAPGGTLVSVGRDSLMRLWNPANGSELARLAGHEHAVRAVAASSDGRFVASAGEESRIILWDLAKRKLSRIFYDPTDFINALSFSPDSRLLASGGEDARVLLFDVSAGKLLYTLRGHSGPVDSVAFSPDGTVLASGGQDTVIHLWDTLTGIQRQTLRGHAAPIRTLTFSPDGRVIASGGEDTLVILWNAKTGRLDRVLFGSSGVINVIVFDPKSKFLATATDDGRITLWSVATGAQLLTITVP